MNRSRLTSMLGLAAKAGKIASGEAGSRAAIVKKRAKLLLLAEDAAASTANDFIILADKHEVPFMQILTKHQIGMAVGKSHRSVLVVLDQGFASQMLVYKEN